MKDVAGITFTRYGGMGLENNSEVIEFESPNIVKIITTKNSFASEKSVSTKVVESNHIYTELMKYVNSSNVYEELRKELESDTLELMIDGGAFSIVFDFDYYKEEYHLGHTHPSSMVKLSRKIDSLLKNV